jgi:hypothetical protein
VAKVEGPAVEMEVDQLSSVEVPQSVALATADHQLSAKPLPDLDPVRGDVAASQLEDALFL